jgi:dienelactone hydrolase
MQKLKSAKTLPDCRDYWSLRRFSPVIILLFSVACSPQAIVPSVTPSSTSTVQPEENPDNLTFTSGDISLVGRLILPAGEGPFPAIIWVHGSGRTTRNEVGSLLDILVEEGIAGFTYDKRGVGDSGGTYSEVSPFQGNDVLGLLAEDAAADFVASQERIDPEHIGFFGASQAGWIVPQAALLSENVSFISLLSGPTVSVGIENIYSGLTPNQGGSLTDEQIDTFSERLANVHSVGYDPRESIEALEIPGLWILGARDASIPVRETAAILNEIKEEFEKDFTIFIYPNANHGMFDAETGIQEPFMSEVLIPWIKEVIQK